MTRWITLLCFVILLSACQRVETAAKHSNTVTPTEEDRITPTIKAVDFVASEGGEIDSANIGLHPEVRVVHTFTELKEVSREENAIWIELCTFTSYCFA